MKIFIDSAKLDEIEEVYCCGILDGVTTNPSLIKTAVDALKKKGDSINMEDYIKKILLTARGTPVSLEVTEYKYEEMITQGRELYKMFNPVAYNVYIKIPVNPSFPREKGREMEGIKAIKTLSGDGIPINSTLIFTPEQALMAAKAGAKIVSPYIGRTDDALRKKAKKKFKKTDYFPQEGLKGKDINGIVSGIDLIKKTVEIFRQHNIDSEVLAASIRNARQTREAALAGAHISTLPMNVIKELLVHNKSEEGMKSFRKDTIPEYVKLTE